MPSPPSSHTRGCAGCVVRFRARGDCCSDARPALCLTAAGGTGAHMGTHTSDAWRGAPGCYTAPLCSSRQDANQGAGRAGTPRAPSLLARTACGVLLQSPTWRQRGRKPAPPKPAGGAPAPPPWLLSAARPRPHLHAGGGRQVPHGGRGRGGPAPPEAHGVWGRRVRDRGDRAQGAPWPGLGTVVSDNKGFQTLVDEYRV